MVRQRTWQKISEALVKTGEDKSLGLKMFREFTRHGSLSITSAQRLAVPAGGVADFYKRLSLIHSGASPVNRRKDDRWLRDADFHFMDIRDYGTFFRVLLEIPRLRGNSIIFLPFTDNRPEFSRFPRSHAHIHQGFSDPFLESCGLEPKEQARLLINGVHLCGKTAGFLLSPLIDPESAVIYRKPEFFAWKQKGKSERSRQSIIREIRELVQKEFDSSETYDYARLRDLMSRYGFYVQGTGKEGMDKAVPFDFHEQEALNYFKNIPTLLQREYNLDFFYLPFPEEMKTDEVKALFSALRRNRDCRAYTGWMAGAQKEMFSSMKENEEPVVLIKEGAPLQKLGEEFINDWFHELGELFEKNLGKKIPVSRAFWLPVEERQEKSLVMRSLFLNRFSGLGLFRRPLAVKGDPGALSPMNKCLEDVYQRYRELLEKGTLIQVVADEGYAWWLIREKGRLLIPLLSLDSPEGKSPGNLRINYGKLTQLNKIFSVIDYDFSSSRGDLFLSADRCLEVRDLKPGSFRLFSLQ